MKLSIIISTISLIMIMALGYWNLSQRISQPTAVVDIQELYQSFAMTKDMEKKYLTLSSERGKVIDSLNTMIQTFQSEKSQEVQPVLVNQKLQSFAYTQASLQQENETIKLELEQQIWRQLNQYLNEFGTSGNYDLILGAQGHGNVIYATNTVDITEEAIEFINQKYQGLN